MSARKYLFVFLLVTTFALGVCAVYLWNSSRNLHSINSNLNSNYPNEINIKSEIPGVEFEFSNKESLEIYLQEFGFWDGMVEVGSPNLESESFISPRALIIHISNEEFYENRTDWEGEIYASATKAELRDDDKFHLWIGLNEGLINGKYKGLENWIDTQLLSGIFTRSEKTIKEPQFVLDNKVSEKLTTKPFIIVK
jgi:hypothetical protein